MQPLKLELHFFFSGNIKEVSPQQLKSAILRHPRGLRIGTSQIYLQRKHNFCHKNAFLILSVKVAVTTLDNFVNPH